MREKIEKNFRDMEIIGNRRKKTFHIFSTKEASFHPEEGYVKMFIRGRPVQLFVPEAMTGGYALSKVSPAPQVR